MSKKRPRKKHYKNLYRLTWRTACEHFGNLMAEEIRKEIDKEILEKLLEVMNEQESKT